MREIQFPIRTSHLVFAIALFLSVATHAVLLGLSFTSLFHKEFNANLNSKPAIDIWNARLMDIPATPDVVVESEYHSQADAPSPSASIESARQSPEHTRGQSQSDIRFYLFDEVETPAIPLDDWMLPQSDHGSIYGLQSAIFRIWILNTGDIQDVSILSTVPAILDADQTRALIEGIKKTRVRPAFRYGEPVASERTIEMVFETGLESGASLPASISAVQY
jgi:hypothetical protein